MKQDKHHEAKAAIDRMTREGLATLEAQKQVFLSRTKEIEDMTNERYMTVLGGYKLDMHNHGHLVREYVARVPGKDYGADPLGNGQFRMIPSGDVVDLQERNNRLGS